MKALFAAVAVVAIFVVASQAVTYTPISAYYEGTALSVWDFGASTAATRTTGNVWRPTVVVPGSASPGGNDPDIGELYVLQCSASPCPDVYQTTGSSIWKSYTTILDSWVKTDDNSTYNNMAHMNPSHNISTGAVYRRFVSSSADRLQTSASSSTSPSVGVHEGSSVYYFGFGLDAYGTMDNSIYVIQGGPTILLNVGTHFVKKYSVYPPPGSNVASYVRIGDIPAGWLSDPNITTTDGVIYEYGFYATAPTAAPTGAAAVALPSFVALLFAIALAMFLSL